MGTDSKTTNEKSKKWRKEIPKKIYLNALNNEHFTIYILHFTTFTTTYGKFPFPDI